MTASSIIPGEIQLKLIFKYTVGTVFFVFFFCLLILENVVDVYMSNAVHILECDN